MALPSKQKYVDMVKSAHDHYFDYILAEDKSELLIEDVVGNIYMEFGINKELIYAEYIDVAGNNHVLSEEDFE